MTIETARLNLVPLDIRQLKMWTNNINELENELNCIYKAEPVVGFFSDIVKGQIELAEQHLSEYIWYSFWFLIRKSDSVVVGLADFKKEPDKNGEVEIGYGLGNGFEHNGYMSEAVNAMCTWAFTQSGISAVFAETDADGYASHRILERCGFEKYSQDETVWWRINKSD